MRLWLKRARKRVGLTQKQLGDMVGKDITTIGKYENGQRHPQVATAKKIAKVLKLDWTLFFEDKVSPKTEEVHQNETRQATNQRTKKHS